MIIVMIMDQVHNIFGSVPAVHALILALLLVFLGLFHIDTQTPTALASYSGTW